MLPTRRIAVLGHIHSYVVVACLKQWFSASASIAMRLLVGMAVVVVIFRQGDVAMTGARL
jgi:hypothetical protein